MVEIIPQIVTRLRGTAENETRAERINRRVLEVLFRPSQAFPEMDTLTLDIWDTV